MKPTHRLRTALLVLTLLIAAVFLAANTIVSPDHWRARFEQLASDAIGKPLRLKGPLHWRLGQGGPGLYAEQVLLANPGWAGGPAFVRAAAVELSLSWANLVRGRIVFDRLVLDEVEVHLQRRHNGDNNWTFTPKDSDKGDSGSKTGAIFDPQIALHGLRISYRESQHEPAWDYRLPTLQIDADPGQALRLHSRIPASNGDIDVALRTKPLQAIFADPLRWPLAGKLVRGNDRLSPTVKLDVSGERPTVSGRLDLHWTTLPAAIEKEAGKAAETPLIETLASQLGRIDADLNVDLDTPSWRGPLTLNLDTGLLQIETSAKTGQPTLTLSWDTRPQPARMAIDLEGGPWDLETIAKRWHLPEPPLVAAEHVRVHLSASGLTKQALLDSLRGELAMEQVMAFRGFDLNVDKLTAKLGEQSLDLDIRGALHKLPYHHEFNVTGSLAQWLDKDQTLPIVSRGRFGSNHIAFKGNLLHRRTQRQLLGTFEANGKDPSEFNTLFASSLPKRLAYRIATGIDIQVQRAAFTDIDAHLGKTRIRGALTIDRTTGRTRIDGKLRFPRLDLATRPAPSRGQSRPAQDQTPAEKTGIAAILSNYDVDIELRIGRLLGTDLDARNLRTHLLMRAGQLKLDALRLSLFGLDTRGSATVQEQDDGIAAELTLNIPRLTREFDYGRAPNNYQLGLKTAKSRIKLKTHGTTSAQWLANTQLDARFDGLSMDLDDQSGTTAERLRFTRARLNKRVGKGLQLQAKGTIDDTPMTLTGRHQARKPGKRGREARIDLSLKAADLEITADAQLSRDDELNSLRFHLAAQHRESLPAPLDQHANRRGPYRIDVDIERYRNGWRTHNLALESGNSDLSGRIDIDLLSKPPKLVLDLKSRRLQPVFSNDKVRWPGTASTNGKQTRLIPDTNLIPQVPAHWDVDYRHRIDQLVLAHNTLSNYYISGSLRKDHLVVDQLRASLPQGGSLVTKVDARVIGEQLRAKISGQARQLDLGWIWTKSDIDRPIPWLTTTEFNIEGRGKNLREFLARAHGGIRFMGGAMEFDTSAMDLWTLDLVSIAIPDLLEHKKKREQGLLCSVAGFAIDKGVMTSQGMLFDTPKAVVLGSGSIDLRSEKIDLLLSPKKKRLSLFSVSTPVLLSGTLMQPKASVPPEQLALTAGSLTLQVVQPWVLAGGLLTSGYRVDNPCLKTFEDMSGKHADKRTRAHSPFNDAIKGLRDAPTRALRDVGREIDEVLP